MALTCVAAALPKSEHLVVPYYSQGARNWCGPASLAMALKYVGVDAEIWDIATGEGKVSQPCGGALDLLTCYQSGATWAQVHENFVRARYAARNRIVTESRTYFVLSSENRLKEQIRQYVSDGYPVMLMSVARVHWIVITGYDEKGVWYHDPSGAFYPACGRGPGCLIDAYLSWPVFMRTLKHFGLAQLQLLVVKNRDWPTVPQAHRAKPKPTIQILPELYWDQRTAGGYGSCSECLINDTGSGSGFSFTFLRNETELNSHRRNGVMIRPELDYTQFWHNTQVRLVMKVFNAGTGDDYAVAAAISDISGRENWCYTAGLSTIALGRDKACGRSGVCWFNDEEMMKAQKCFSYVDLQNGMMGKDGDSADIFAWILENTKSNTCSARILEPRALYLHVLLMRRGAAKGDSIPVVDSILIPLTQKPENAPE